MLDIEILRKEPEKIKDALKKRGVAGIDVKHLQKLDEAKRKLIGQVDGLKQQRNVLSDEISKKRDKTKIKKAAGLKQQVEELEKQLEVIAKEFDALWQQVPNLVHPDAPVGGEENNRVLFVNKEPKKLSFKPKDHEELFLDLDLIDFERGAKVAGTKFYFAKNQLVLLNQALIQYGIGVVTKHGFILMETPDVAKNEILAGIGYQPRGPETQVYSLENTDLSLIGTAEITVGGYHKDEILDLSQGPKKYVALSHCFRTEAGSYGKAGKGLFRVHQFTKLEMFVYCKPEDSEKIHQELLEIEKEICDGLGLTYRVVDNATRDLGVPAYRKFDIEAWMVMKAEKGEQGGYGEITSTSNCTDYQARNLNIKYRRNDGKLEFVHTLNGTAVVTSRFPVAIAEQFQQEDGSILVPEVLQKYTGFSVIN